MPPRRSNPPKVTTTAPSAQSPPVSSRVRKRGPSNADDKQTKLKTKKQRADEESDYEEEGKAQGSGKKKEKKEKKKRVAKTK